MFETLSEKLSGVFQRLGNKGRLTEKDVDEALREVRIALLEADVNFRVARDFVYRIRVEGIGPSQLGELFVQTLVGLMSLNDGHGPVLPPYEPHKVEPRVPRIHHDELRIEFTRGETSLAQNVGRSLLVVDVASTDVCRYRQLRFGVYKEVKLPAIHKLSDSLRALFDRPSRLSVRFDGPPSIGVGFHHSAVQGSSIIKGWQVSVVASHKSARYVFKPRKEFLRGQPRKKAARRRLVRDAVGRRDSTDSSNERVGGEQVYQRPGGGQAHVMLSDVALPQNFGGMSLWATPYRASQSINKAGTRIVEVAKDCPKLCDDGRGLSFRPNGGIISGDHGKIVPSCWFRGRKALPRFVAPFFMS